jgi:uncharacterized protein (TIGR03643 family)
MTKPMTKLTTPRAKTSQDLDPAIVSEIIEMALSDHIPFEDIGLQHGITADEVKALMRRELKPGSYRAWRKRVRHMRDHRSTYK